jgi:AraC family transcriptional regulator
MDRPGMNRFLDGLRYIEANLPKRFTVAHVARAAGYSVYHYCRLFNSLTGDSVMSYARKRRLTVAAQALTNGGDARLIELALDCGFASQAAFTRAFKRHFGVPPGAVRRSGREWLPRCRWPIDATALSVLMETLTMEPTFKEREDIDVVGLREEAAPRAGVDGVSLWRRFHPMIPAIPHRRGKHELGVIEILDKTTGALAYSAAIEVERGAFKKRPVPAGLTAKTLPGGRFAVFTLKLTNGDIGGELRRTFGYIYGTWVPKSGIKLRAQYDLELYDERFDPKTLSGEIDIWVPVK